MESNLTAKKDMAMAAKKDMAMDSKKRTWQWTAKKDMAMDSKKDMAMDSKKDMTVDSNKGYGNGQQKRTWQWTAKKGLLTAFQRGAGELLQALCKLHFNYFTTIKTQNTFQLYVLKKIHKLYKVSIKFIRSKKRISWWKALSLQDWLQ